MAIVRSSSSSMLAARSIPEASIDILRTGHTKWKRACEFFAGFRAKRTDQRPTALLAMNDLAAIGAMRAAMAGRHADPRGSLRGGRRGCAAVLLFTDHAQLESAGATRRSTRGRRRSC